MINNKTITLYSIGWGEYLPIIERVVNHCNKIFPFFDEVKINKEISDLYTYNQFFVQDLTKHINTDFVLVVQNDGFIINPSLWDNNFLSYDYIGAPWPWHKVVGNGGFCIRSKKFLDLSSKLVYKEAHPEYKYCPEDYFLCVLNRNYFIDNGCIFPSMETAIKFSFEHPIPGIKSTIRDSFGFHGKHNLK